VVIFFECFTSDRFVGSRKHMTLDIGDVALK
jgi:hypothetical protein